MTFISVFSRCYVQNPQIIKHFTVIIFVENACQSHKNRYLIASKVNKHNFSVVISALNSVFVWDSVFFFLIFFLSSNIFHHRFDVESWIFNIITLFVCASWEHFLLFARRWIAEKKIQSDCSSHQMIFLPAQNHIQKFYCEIRICG